VTRVKGVAWPRYAAPLAVLIAAIAGSCTEIGTSPTTVTALEFDSLPYPAVVTGDTLRDSLGRAGHLHAVAFNAAGSVVANAAISFLALDSGVTIDPATGVVTAQLRNGTVRIIASVAGLQTAPETLIVTRRPDSVVATSPLTDTINYTLPDSPSNVSPALTLQVATRDTANGIQGSQGWLVSYQVLYHGRALAVTDTTIASLLTTGSLPTLLDTTAVGGLASSTLRVRSTLLPPTADSITVVASVRYHGLPVPGSPVTYLIQLRPIVK
jgi:hypothetical protein